MSERVDLLEHSRWARVILLPSMNVCQGKVQQLMKQHWMLECGVMLEGTTLTDV